ncbi:MAG: molybdopterin cofactor-binding domain-containing protein [Pseudomonadota bacterium]
MKALMGLDEFEELVGLTGETGGLETDRRQVVKLLGAGALTLGVLFGSPRAATADTDNKRKRGNGVTSFSPGVYITVHPDDTLEIICHRSEMGQGIRTSMPMIIADEMGARWDQITLTQGTGDPKFGDQNTDGSTSIRKFYWPLRKAAAQARTMLIRAAAQELGIEEAELKAENGTVIAPDGRSIAFGKLTATASTLELPAEDDVALKATEDFTMIGKSKPLVDMKAFVTGEGRFGMDAQLPGMKFAVVARPPVVGAKPVDWDTDAALAVQGVERVVKLPDAEAPYAFKPLGGVAIVARDTWAAMKGRKALNVKWSDSPNDGFESTAYREALAETAKSTGEVVLKRGKGSTVLEADTGKGRIEAEYYVPLLAQSPMEPPVALAHTTATKCLVFASTQDPQTARGMVAGALNMKPEQVEMNITLLGGGFGRKSKPDFIVEAALISKMADAPVKVIWSREDDLHHGYYHAMSVQRIAAKVNEDGTPKEWHHRSVFPSIMETFNPAVERPSKLEVSLGLIDLPFQIPNVQIETGKAKSPLRIGWLRSVSNIQHAFAIGSFVDELAHQAGQDPLDYWRTVIGDPRLVDPADGEGDYTNYGEPMERFPIDTARLRAVLDLAAEKAGWSQDLPEGEGMGIAVHRSFVTYVATAAHVAVADGVVSVKSIDMAVDCGRFVHKDRVMAQMEGAAIYGLSAALYSQVTAKDGRIIENNFDGYEIARIDATPTTRVHLIDNDAEPGGVGEPGVPPVAPAIVNAIFAATGKRIRSLPVGKQLSI